jgi:hypothetical protein
MVYNFLRGHVLGESQGVQIIVGEFFDLHEQIVEENNLSETRIFNATVQKIQNLENIRLEA